MPTFHAELLSYHCTEAITSPTGIRSLNGWYADQGSATRWHLERARAPHLSPQRF
jgi:hypothetical protein